MQFAIKPDKQNRYPEAGIIVRGSSPAQWFRVLGEMNISLSNVNIYPLPGTIANTIWGCFVEYTAPVKKTEDLRQNEICCCANELLFIPSYTSVYPQITVAETATLLKGRKHFMHPEIGLVELPEAIDPSALVELPQENFQKISSPKSGEFVPQRIKSFMVKPLPPKEALKAMEDGFPKTESLENKSLNIAEKARLAFYRRLFSRTKNKETGKIEIGHKSSFSALDKILGLFGGSSNKKWAENMEEDFEELEKRNQNEMDRLIEMLKNNPDEALKYAIPINDGASRGPQEGHFTLSQRWNTFSLFGNNSGGGGGSFTSGRASDLAAEYSKIAQELIRKKDFRKAAFIYHKLLKQPFLAAETLEKGELYQEAAAIYLEFLKNKERAAFCYEKGNMTQTAILLYKELNKHEKVGDLYIKLNRRNDAHVYYEKAADEHESKKQYVKASLIYREKMLKPESGQEMLLNGWRENCDAQNCMGVYFSNIQSDRARSEAYATFYTDEVDDDNRTMFIAVAASEYKKHAVHAEQLKTLAYEAAVLEIPKNPAVVSGLTEFNKNDKQFTSDTIRFRNTNKPIVQPSQAAIPAPVTPSAPREESLTFAEVMPSFPGGESAMRAYLSANVRYPQLEKELGKSGSVKVGFDITRDGKVENVRTLQGVPDAPGLSREAERVVSTMQRWIPGTMNGRPVRVTTNITVTFKLV